MQNHYAKRLNTLSGIIGYHSYKHKVKRYRKELKQLDNDNGIRDLHKGIKLKRRGSGKMDLPDTEKNNQGTENKQGDSQDPKD